MNSDIAIIHILSGHPGLAYQVGSTGMGNARVFSGDVPQGEVFPVVMVDLYDAEPFDTKDGASVVDHEMVKVFCYGSTAKEARNLSDEVRNALDSVSGTYNSQVIQDIRYMRSDSQRIELTNRKVYLREMDFMVRIEI
jgi:hypothetical protein